MWVKKEIMISVNVYNVSYFLFDYVTSIYKKDWWYAFKDHGILGLKIKSSKLNLSSKYLD